MLQDDSDDDDEEEEVNNRVNIPTLGGDSGDSDVDDPGDDQGQVDSNDKQDVVDAVLSYLTTMNQPANQSPSLIRHSPAQSREPSIPDCPHFYYHAHPFEIPQNQSLSISVSCLAIIR